MRRALIDLRSVLWTGLLASKDIEFGRKVMFGEKEVHVNSAAHGYDNAVDHILLVLDELKIQPRDVIFADDGRNSKALRQTMFGGYKAGRDQAPEVTDQFNIAKEMLLKAFTQIGAQVCWQEAMEADDVLGYLSRHLDGEKWVVTNDGDMVVLIDEANDAHVIRQGRKDYNHYGPFSPKYTTVYKALVGDSSDGYGGAYKFGDAAFIKLLTAFGEEGLEAMKGLIEKKRLVDLAEDVAEVKELQCVIDGAEMVYTSYALAKLYPEKINTMRRPLQWRVGMVSDISLCEDERLRKFHSQVRLIHAANYDEAVAWAQKQFNFSPYVALDIETSTPEASDEWLRMQGKEDGNVVDVFGSELTGLGLTFGPNMQYTFYLTHDHVEEAGVANLTREQVRDFVGSVPRSKLTLVHNAQFELPVLYNTWGEDWKGDPEYHGFLPNVRDTAVLSSYADENRRANLKGLSSEVLGYAQVTYEQVTTRTYDADRVPVGGKEVRRYTGDDDVEYVVMQYKMNELTAKEVLSYGADDCICTAAIYNHFRVICEIENTYEVFDEVETFPAYLTALGFVHGVDFSPETMRAMELDDDKQYDESCAILRAYLVEKEWEGVICPSYDEITPAAVKEVFAILTGETLEMRVRKIDRMAHEVGLAADSISDEEVADKVRVLSVIVGNNNHELLNELVAANFTGEPRLDLGSPKQMKAFLYDHIGMPINIINDVTDTEKKNNPALAKAAIKFKQFRSGKDIVMSEDDMLLLRQKAKTDDTAIAFGLAFDRDKIGDREAEILDCIGKMKTVMTRRSLFYKNYRNARHWKDGKIHASLRQTGTVTRRYSSSNPNLQQIPKKGEGVKFRECFIPHHRNAVICSIDFAGQELRLAAEASQDKNMLACYVGNNLKDIHSITASSSMKLKWGAEVVKGLFEEYGEASNDEYGLFLKLRNLGKSDKLGKKADDLRKDSKNVNFTAQFGGKAAKISERLIMPLEDAQLFLTARSDMFPDVDVAAEKSAQKCKEVGYAQTFMGGRRHLREGITSADRGSVERAARQSWNMEIQGSAAEMTKLAMARVWTSGVPFRYDFRFVAPIHDELVFSVGGSEALEAIREVHECMVEKYSTMEVPILGSISLGLNFGEQQEAGDWFIQENIEKILTKLFPKKEAA